MSNDNNEGSNQEEYYDSYSFNTEDNGNITDHTNNTSPIGNGKDCKRSNIQVFEDNWSLGKNPNCTFPFSYKGVEYYNCTMIDSQLGKLWCANSCDFNESNPNHMKYGLCKVDGNDFNSNSDFSGDGNASKPMPLADSPVAQFFIAMSVIIFFITCCACYIRRRRKHRELRDSNQRGIEISEFDGEPKEPSNRVMIV